MKVLKIGGELFIILLCIFQAVYCKPEWYEAKDGTRFLIENQEEYNWYDAFYKCADRNLKLLAIESKAKNNALKEVLLANFDNINNLWIGGFDKFGERHDKSRPFYWIDSDFATGKPISYTHWAIRQPDNYKRREHCVHIWGHYSFRWNDNSCHKQEFGYICEEKDIQYNKVENVNDKETQDEKENSKQHDNINYSHTSDIKTEVPIEEMLNNDPNHNNDWVESLHHIQQKTEVNILDILFNQKAYRLMCIKK